MIAEEEQLGDAGCLKPVRLDWHQLLRPFKAMLALPADPCRRRTHNRQIPRLVLYVY